jgi:hypothetical protein
MSCKPKTVSRTLRIMATGVRGPNPASSEAGGAARYPARGLNLFIKERSQRIAGDPAVGRVTLNGQGVWR